MNLTGPMQFPISQNNLPIGLKQVLRVIVVVVVVVAAVVNTKRSGKNQNPRNRERQKKERGHTTSAATESWIKARDAMARSSTRFSSGAMMNAISKRNRGPFGRLFWVWFSHCAFVMSS